MDRVNGHVLRDAFERGVAIISHYGVKELLLALAVGFAVQLLALLVFRLIGATVRLVIRFFAWTLGVATALYLIHHDLRLPVGCWHELASWLGLALNILRHAHKGLF